MPLPRGPPQLLDRAGAHGADWRGALTCRSRIRVRFRDGGGLRRTGDGRMENVQLVVEGSIVSLRVDLAKELERQAGQWREAADLARKQWEESHWYLGEALASVKRLEEQLQGLQEAYAQPEERHRDVTARLQEAEQERDEAKMSLTELQAAQEGLLQQIQQLIGQVAEAQGNLSHYLRAVSATCSENNALRR